MWNIYEMMCCGSRGIILLSCTNCQSRALFCMHGTLLTISTRVIADVISSQHPQFMGKRWTLRMNHDRASSVFFSLAKIMP